MAEYLTETYALKENEGELLVAGRRNGLAALCQAISLMLQVEEGAYPIFSADYGLATHDLLGKDRAYVIPEIERRVSEALLNDDRILAVEDFSFTAHGRRLSVKFLVRTIYGDISQEAEVAV